MATKIHIITVVLVAIVFSCVKASDLKDGSYVVPLTKDNINLINNGKWLLEL
jgi:hypothetical protein